MHHTFYVFLLLSLLTLLSEFTSLYCPDLSTHLTDYVLKKGNDHIIFESEGATSRKTFVGGLVKAAHFLQGELTGSLIFVMVPRPNTTSISIQKHLKKYLDWLSDKTNLRDVYVIDNEDYYKDDKVLLIDESEFLRLSHKV